MSDKPVERIWLKETHEDNGWKFGYWANQPQDDAFTEYVRVPSSVKPNTDEREGRTEPISPAVEDRKTVSSPLAQDVARKIYDAIILSDEWQRNGIMPTITAIIAEALPPSSEYQREALLCPKCLSMCADE